MAGRATDRVVDTLRKATLTLGLQPGATLEKAALTASFGVSRFPVTEALNRLKAEGLVDIHPQSGTTVALIRLADVRENILLRKALEVETVAMLATRHDAILVAELRRNLRYQNAAFEAEDRDEFYRLDLAFHDLLIGASGYPRVHATVEAAETRTRPSEARARLTAPPHSQVSSMRLKQVMVLLRAPRWPHLSTPSCLSSKHFRRVTQKCSRAPNNRGAMKDNAIRALTGVFREPAFGPPKSRVQGRIDVA